MRARPQTCRITRHAFRVSAVKVVCRSKLLALSDRGGMGARDGDTRVPCDGWVRQFECESAGRLRRQRYQRVSHWGCRCARGSDRRRRLHPPAWSWMKRQRKVDRRTHSSLFQADIDTWKSLVEYRPAGSGSRGRLPSIRLDIWPDPRRRNREVRARDGGARATRKCQLRANPPEDHAARATR